MTQPLKLLNTALVATLLAGCAAPGYGPNYGHPALNAIPQYQVVYVQPVPVGPPPPVVYVPAPPVNHYSNAWATVGGATVGGLAGLQVGNGNGRLAAGAIGATLGGMAAQGAGSQREVVGGLAGGLIGSRFGDGRGRAAATVFGAGLGAFLAAPPQ
jgi:uncharacterized protein YcfJ